RRSARGARRGSRGHTLSGRVDLAEFLSAFVAEADEQLVVATARLLAIEQAERAGARDPRGVRDAFRALHTIKGLSSMVGVDAIVTLAHAMESVLRPADRAGGTLPVGGIDPLVKGVRAIELRVRALERGERGTPAPDDLIAELDALVSGPASNQTGAGRLVLDPAIEPKLVPFERELLLSPTGGRRALRIDFAPSPERAAPGLTINPVRDRGGAPPAGAPHRLRAVAGARGSWPHHQLGARSGRRPRRDRPRLARLDGAGSEGAGGLRVRAARRDVCQRRRAGRGWRGRRVVRHPDGAAELDGGGAVRLPGARLAGSADR